MLSEATNLFHYRILQPALVTSLRIPKAKASASLFLFPKTHTHIISRTITKFKHKRVDSANITSSHWQSENGIFYIWAQTVLSLCLKLRTQLEYPRIFDKLRLFHSISGSLSRCVCVMDFFLPSVEKFISDIESARVILSLAPSLFLFPSHSILRNVCIEIQMLFNSVQSRRKRSDRTARKKERKKSIEKARAKENRRASITFLFANCKYPTHILHHYR